MWQHFRHHSGVWERGERWEGDGVSEKRWKIMERDDKGRWFVRTGSQTRSSAVHLLNRYVELGTPRDDLRLERES